jgi:hypothetical protein
LYLFDVDNWLFNVWFSDVGFLFEMVNYFIWNVIMKILNNKYHIQLWYLIYVYVRFDQWMIMIDDLFLKYFHRIGSLNLSLFFCIEWSFCFSSSHLLQADSQNQCDQWINSLQLAISQSFKTPNGALQNSSSVCSFYSIERKKNVLFLF